MNEKKPQTGTKSPADEKQKKQGSQVRRLIENDTFVLVISLIGAVLVWLSVAYNTDEKVSATVHNVPISFDASASLLERLSLYPVMIENATVDVEINGNRAVIGNVTKEELLVSGKLGNVTGPGTYEITFETSDRLGRDFEIKNTSPEALTVRFDHRTDKTLPVELVLDGVVIPEGYILDAEYITPEEITISGPETEVSEITTCRLSLALAGPLTESFTAEQEPQLYNADGEEITSPYLSMSADAVTFTLPVLKKKTVPVTIDFINVPDGFDVNTLWYEISPHEIEIAGPESTIGSVTEVHLGYINLSAFVPEIPLSYYIKLPSGYISVDNTQEAVVTFDSDDYETRFYDVSEIKLINQPDEYNVTVSTKMIYDVQITGPAEDLDELSASDLVAEIDMREVDVRLGQSTVPVSIIVTSNNTCWASGSTSNAVVTVRSKEASN